MPNSVHSRLVVSFRTVILLVTAIGLFVVCPGEPLLAQDASHSPGWVVISVPEYRALRVKAYPTEREPEPPPVDATLTRVDYDLRVDTDLASGRATLTVDVLKNGWVRVPIPAGLFVREAKLDGKSLSLAPPSPGKDASQLSALLSHPGRSVITLEIALPISSSASEERLSIPSTFSGTYQLSAHAPGFQTMRSTISYDAANPRAYQIGLNVGATNQSIEVSAEAITLNTESTQIPFGKHKKVAPPPPAPPPPSVNVYNLQQRVAGVLPVAVDIPRAGASYRFLRPLVLNEETKLSFTYKSK